MTSKAMRDVQKGLLDLAVAKAEAKVAAEKVALAERTLIDRLHNAGQKTVSVVLTNGDAVKGTLVEPQTVTIDEDALKKRLGATLWKKVTKTVLDKAKLEAAVSIGEIKQTTVAEVSTIKDIKPSVRVSGTYAPEDAQETLDDIIAGKVTITDSTGKVKPAVAKRVRPRSS